MQSGNLLSAAHTGSWSTCDIFCAQPTYILDICNPIKTTEKPQKYINSSTLLIPLVFGQNYVNLTMSFTSKIELNWNWTPSQFSL